MMIRFIKFINTNTRLRLTAYSLSIWRIREHKPILMVSYGLFLLILF